MANSIKEWKIFINNSDVSDLISKWDYSESREPEYKEVWDDDFDHNNPIKQIRGFSETTHIIELNSAVEVDCNDSVLIWIKTGGAKNTERSFKVKYWTEESDLVVKRYNGLMAFRVTPLTDWQESAKMSR